jgi:ABC-type sugar transport system ATPase subunit
MDPLLSVRGLTKRYGGVQALAGVDLEVRPGEVHALVGENGAGKSTLLKILSGAVRPDSGDLRFAGAPLPVGSPRASETCGIVAIYQEFTLIPALTATQNIFLGHETSVPGRGAARRAAMRARTESLVADLLGQTGGSGGLDPDRPVRELSVPERQMVEIARALSRESRLILMDEPTATLTTQETARLHETVRRLRARGVSVLYISHRLEEVLSLADRVTILRDGRRVETVGAGEATLDRLIRGMVGRSITEHYAKEPAAPGEPFWRSGRPRVSPCASLRARWSVWRVWSDPAGLSWSAPSSARSVTRASPSPGVAARSGSRRRGRRSGWGSAWCRRIARDRDWC